MLFHDAQTRHTLKVSPLRHIPSLLISLLTNTTIMTFSRVHFSIPPNPASTHILLGYPKFGKSRIPSSASTHARDLTGLPCARQTLFPSTSTPSFSDDAATPISPLCLISSFNRRLAERCDHLLRPLRHDRVDHIYPATCRYLNLSSLQGWHACATILLIIGGVLSAASALHGSKEITLGRMRGRLR